MSDTDDGWVELMDIQYSSREEAGRIDRGVAVVVDVMRAYTTAACALHAGAAQIVLTDDTEDAVRIAARIDGALLCKDSEPDPRFLLTNSPDQIQSIDLVGRTVVQRTTAGTVGAMAARGAEQIFVTGLVTAQATANALLASHADRITFVVTGGNGTAEEDLACAQYVAAILESRGAGEIDSAPYVQRARLSAAAQRLADAVDAGFVGVRPGDVELCLDVDRFSFSMPAVETTLGLSLSAARQDLSR